MSICKRDLQRNPGIAAWRCCHGWQAPEVRPSVSSHQATPSRIKVTGPSCPAPRGQAVRLSTCSRLQAFFTQGMGGPEGPGPGHRPVESGICASWLCVCSALPTHRASQTGPSTEAVGRGPRPALTGPAVPDPLPGRMQWVWGNPNWGSGLIGLPVPPCPASGGRVRWSHRGTRGQCWAWLGLPLRLC